MLYLSWRQAIVYPKLEKMGTLSRLEQKWGPFGTRILKRVLKWGPIWEQGVWCGLVDDLGFWLLWVHWVLWF